MAYLHGTYGAFDKSIGLVPVAQILFPYMWALRP